MVRQSANELHPARLIFDSGDCGSKCRPGFINVQPFCSDLRNMRTYSIQYYETRVTSLLFEQILLAGLQKSGGRQASNAHTYSIALLTVLLSSRRAQSTNAAQQRSAPLTSMAALYLARS